MKGYFITFEGLEGAGKTTQAKILHDALSKDGYPCVLTSEPGGTSLGHAVKKLITDLRFDDMTALSELYLICAARAQHVEKLIRPSLEEGKIVICDRFIDASIAYQCFGRGLPENLVRETSSRASWNVYPDLTIYLDVEPAQGLTRIYNRIQELEKPADRIEKENLEFFNRVKEGYFYVSREEPKRFRIIDGNQEKCDLARKIFDMVSGELKKLKFKNQMMVGSPASLQETEKSS
jgi:dTMP kinase